MTCKDCFSYLACKQWMDWQNDDWDYLRDEYPNNKNAHIFCGQFHYKSKVVELPLKIEDRETMRNALENISLYTIGPCVECANCPKPKIGEGCCQELKDVYDNKHKKYSPYQDWDFMCENCPLVIEEIEFTESRYKYALDLRQNKEDFNIKDVPVFLNKQEAEAKLKELNKNG